MRAVTGKLSLDVEPGTVVGPDSMGEFHVALYRDSGKTYFAYATPADIATALAREARSVTEQTDRERLESYT